MQLAVRTPNGIHDIDQLSSGERELLSVFINLFRIRNLPSVILYDEPERHLNAGLESRIIPALDKLQSQNQLRIATHGVELIGSVPMTDIVALKRDAGSTPPDRFIEDSKTGRVRVFEALGARVGLQLVSNRVVLLEGKDSSADKRVLDKLAGVLLPGVLFVASGSSQSVIGAGTRVGLIIEKASTEASFLMVLDRDYRDIASADKLKAKLNNRVYIWSCHELENLLIVPEILLKVLKFNGVDRFKDDKEVKDALLAGAKALSSVFANELASYRLHSTANAELDDEKPNPTPKDEDYARNLAAKALRRALAAYSPDSVGKAINEAAKEVRRCLGTQDWMIVLPVIRSLLAERDPQEIT